MNARFTKEELLSGEIEVHEVIEPLFDLIDLEDGASYRRTMEPFTLPQRYLFAVEVYIQEVYNGGHDQFFYNSSGVVWQDALEGLTAIGADEAATILRGVMKKIGQSLPDDAELRREMMETLEEGLFEADDDAFYGMDIDFEALEKAYIRAHAAEFSASAETPPSDIAFASGIPGDVKSALYYRDCYFLPVGYADAADFIASAKQQPLPMTVQAIVLREKSDVDIPSSYELGVCLAPYFITDYIKGAEPVVIEDASDLYPVKVELLTQQAYNDRLRRQVEAYCPGCRGFGSLSKSDSSLSGHFDEITLDGFCPYRWETRNHALRFHLEMAYLGSIWHRYRYAQQSADDVMADLKQDLKLSYTSGMIVEDRGKRSLVLYVKKSGLLLTALTDVLAKYISEHVDPSYAIRLNGRAEIDEAAVTALLSPKKIASTRKEFKKYGVAVGILDYDPECSEKVAGFMDDLIEEGMAYTLLAEPGRMTCLLTDEANALMRMRYAAPMLETCAATITVYGALKTAQYTISFDMPQTVLDLAPVAPPKPKKISKRLLKAEEGRVLKRDQAKHLFDYVDIRLSDVGCDHTPRFTDIWLRENLPAEQYEAAVEEIQSMGGFCDCEVLMNCYEDYDLDE